MVPHFFLILRTTTCECRYCVQQLCLIEKHLSNRVNRKIRFANIYKFTTILSEHFALTPVTLRE